MADTVVTAVQKFLASQTVVTDLLGSDSTFGPWVFQDKLHRNLANSQTCAIVINAADSWTSPNPHNTMRFPQVTLALFADPQRDSQNRLTTDDTTTKIENLHAAVFSVMHLTDATEQMWGDLRVLRSSCLNEPQVRPFIDGDHAASALITYALGI